MENIARSASALALEVLHFNHAAALRHSVRLPPFRIEADIEDVRVPFLSRAELIRNKRASGRKKDLADLESLGDEGRS